MRYEDRKIALVKSHWRGHTNAAVDCGLRIVTCSTPGCKAEEYWLEGNARDEKFARKWIAKHKLHYGCHCKNCRADDCPCDRCTRKRTRKAGA